MYFFSFCRVHCVDQTCLQPMTRQTVFGRCCKQSTGRLISSVTAVHRETWNCKDTRYREPGCNCVSADQGDLESTYVLFTSLSPSLGILSGLWNVRLPSYDSSIVQYAQGKKRVQRSLHAGLKFPVWDLGEGRAQRNRDSASRNSWGGMGDKGTATWKAEGSKLG